MPTDEVYGPWPDSGEVDVLEYIGREAELPKSFLHTKGYNFKIGNNPRGDLNIPTADSAFHIYGVNWTPTKMVPFAEDHEMFTWTKTAEGPTQWPFDQNFYLIANLALGGGYGGAVDDGALPARLLVDYIRVYQPL
jgi:beta-glucanase (GH16 family)